VLCQFYNSEAENILMPITDDFQHIVCLIGVSLKDIQTETVAEAMVNMFTRVGVPKEILSD